MPQSLFPQEKVRPVDMEDKKVTVNQIRASHQLGTTDIVQYRGKDYILVRKEGRMDDMDGYSMLVASYESRGRDWFVVDGYTSENQTDPVVALFAEIPNENPDAMATTYRSAIRHLTALGRRPSTYSNMCTNG